MHVKKISASLLKTFKKCQFAYYLNYIAGIRQTSNEKMANGNVVHYGLEMWAKGDKNYIENLKKDYRERKPFALTEDYEKVEKPCDSCPFYNSGICKVLDENVATFEGCPKEGFEFCIKMTEQVLERPDNPIIDNKILGVEKEFNLEICGVKSNGYIDLVSEVNPQIVEIRDWKSGGYCQSYEQVRKDLQAKIYDLAIKQIYPEYDGIWVTLDYLQKYPVTVVFTDEDRERNKIEIRKIIDDIERIKKPKRRSDDWMCKSMCIKRENCDKLWKDFKKVDFDVEKYNEGKEENV